MKTHLLCKGIGRQREWDRWEIEREREIGRQRERERQRKRDREREEGKEIGKYIEAESERRRKG